MKHRLISLAAVFAAVVTTASAQQMAVPGPVTTHEPRPVSDPANNSSVAFDQGYIWYSEVWPRVDVSTRADTNSWRPIFPLRFNGAGSAFQEMRGFGQIFAPHMYYTWYNNAVYNEESNRRLNDNDESLDLALVGQFQNAKAFTVDSMQVFVYQNTRNATPEYPVKIMTYETGASLTGSYRTNGFKQNRSALIRRDSLILSPEDLLTKYDEGQDAIYATKVVFPEGGLEFASGKSMVVLVVNDDAPAPVGGDPNNPIPTDGDYQHVIGALEYKEGSFDPEDTFRIPIDPYKTLGVIDLKTNTSEQVISAWKSGFGVNLQSDPPAFIEANFDMNMIFWGTVDVTTDVKLHFGNSTDAQGIGAITPNPVTANARVPFSLGKRAVVKLELFTLDGQLVRTLAAGDFDRGNYSADLHAGELSNGTYLVRMSAGENFYTTKINVAK